MSLPSHSGRFPGKRPHPQDPFFQQSDNQIERHGVSLESLYLPDRTIPGREERGGGQIFQRCSAEKPCDSEAECG